MSKSHTEPDFSLETAAHKRGFTHVAGVDEVGRGPLAGPVTAAAVILDPTNIPTGINDSKKLSEAARLRLAEQIKASSVWAIAHASVQEIDEINILNASHLAMKRALEALETKAEYALIDGNRMPKMMTIPAECVVKGDAKSLSIAAASILAKVERDQIMGDLAEIHTEYGWKTNAGYPSKQHLAALQQYGATPHHRITFAPVRKILCEEN